MKNKPVYVVLADHPVLKRIDKIVQPEEINQFESELIEANYENIRITECFNGDEIRKAFNRR